MKPLHTQQGQQLYEIITRACRRQGASGAAPGVCYPTEASIVATSRSDDGSAESTGGSLGGPTYLLTERSFDAGGIIFGFVV